MPISFWLVWARWILVALLLTIAFFFSGSLIWTSGLLIWVVMISIGPIILSTIAPRFEPMVGAISNLIVEISLAITRHNYSADNQIDILPWYHVSSQFIVSVAAFSVLFGAIIGCLFLQFRIQSKIK